jgi:hypothetical protein
VDFVVALLEGGDALGEVAGDEGRALPGERAGERAAGDVLGTPLSKLVNGISSGALGQ